MAEGGVNCAAAAVERDPLLARHHLLARISCSGRRSFRATGRRLIQPLFQRQPLTATATLAQIVGVVEWIVLARHLGSARHACQPQRGFASRCFHFRWRGLRLAVAKGAGELVARHCSCKDSRSRPKAAAAQSTHSANQRK